MGEFSGLNDSLPFDPNHKLEAKTESVAEDGPSGLRARWVADLAVGEMRLAEVFLTAAHSADKNGYDALRVEYLRKAFVLFCQARLHLQQLPDGEQSLLHSALGDELQPLQKRILEAFPEGYATG